MLRRTFISLAAARLGFAAAGAATDDDGALIVDGERRFILGLYDLPKVENVWPQAQTAGFNLIHVRPTREDFALARRHHLRTWVSLGSISDAKRAEDEARIRRVVQDFRDDPALLFWETEDEPAFVPKSRNARISPGQIIRTHDFVRQLDRAHPLHLNHAPVNLESTLRKYNAGAEILAVDIYPVIPHGIRELYALWPDGQQGDLPDTSISQVGLYADKMRRVAGPSRAIFMVLQGFAWEDLRKNDKDPKMVLYPDRAQLRSMMYQAIVHGANGILFWGLPYAPAGAPIWDNLRSVTKELAAFMPALSARRAELTLGIEYRETGHSVGRGLEWIAKPWRNGLLILCVNADRNPVEAGLQVPSRFRTCEILPSGEKMPLRNGVLEQSFAPFEAKAMHLA